MASPTVMHGSADSLPRLFEAYVAPACANLPDEESPARLLGQRRPVVQIVIRKAAHVREPFSCVATYHMKFTSDYGELERSGLSVHRPRLVAALLSA